MKLPWIPKIGSKLKNISKSMFLSGQEHTKTCNQGFKFESAKTLSIEQSYMERKVREAVKIRKYRRSGTTVANWDSGS